jgi:hypothetical protein
MPVPSYLSQNPNYDRIEEVTDTATLIAPIQALLEARGWTDEGGGIHKSPVTADGRYFTVEFDSDDGSNLRLAVEDDLARAAQIARFDISGTVVIDVWCGAGYLFVQNTTDGEWFAVALLDTFPEAGDSHPNVVAVGGFRTGDGTQTNATPFIWSVYDEQSEAYTALTGEAIGFLETQSLGVNTAPIGTTAIGTRREWPLLVFGNDNTQIRLRGRVPNMLLFSVVGGASPGMRIPVVFDEADTRTFAVTSITAGRGWRLGIRED